jgi:predicted secreted protein
MKCAFAGALLAIVVGSAHAASADTILKLSESARVKVRPDELAATMKASATTAGAAEAQQLVNAAITKSLQQAHAVEGIAVSTGTYQVWHAVQPKDEWHAEQTMELHSNDGANLLKLVGALQAEGLTSGELGWRVSAETKRRARSEAMRMALGNLRRRAEEAASILGLHFVSFQEVRLQGSRPPVAPRAMAMAMTAAGAPPHAEAEDATIEATVEGDVVLQPPATQ